MKLFQIVGGFCHWDASDQIKSIDYAKSHFPPTDIFVEAPDCVFEGWGCEILPSGDVRFIRPEPPDGWLYDDASGTIYPADETPPAPAKSNAELTAENERLRATITDLELALCDVYETMLAVTGG